MEGALGRAWRGAAHGTWSLRMVLHRCDWVTRQLHLKGGRTRTDQNGASTLPVSKGEA